MTKYQSNFLVQLNDQPNSNSEFKILSAFKYKTEQSKYIAFGDKIILACDVDREAYVLYLPHEEYIGSS